MKRNLLWGIVLTVALVSGCGGQAIRQGQDLSSSGIAYTDAVNNLLDVAVDRVIDFDNAELKKTRRGSDPRAMIIQKNEALLGLIAEMNRFRAQTKLLKSYFLNLQELANSTVKNDVGGAVEALSGSISNLNKTLSGPNGKASLTDDQKKQIGALGGLVAHSVQGAVVQHALSRDAEIIGTYLCYQENQLRNISDILKDRFDAENDLFLEEKVIVPYADRTKELPATWTSDRKQWFKTQFVVQNLNTAQIAAKQLRGVWADILVGKSDVDSLRALITDVNEFVTTAKALKDASPTH